MLTITIDTADTAARAAAAEWDPDAMRETFMASTGHRTVFTWHDADAVGAGLIVTQVVAVATGRVEMDAHDLVPGE